MAEVEGLKMNVQPAEYTADDPPLLWVPLLCLGLILLLLPS